MRVTELQRWNMDGLPPDMFKYQDCIRGDIEAVISAIIDHIEEEKL